MDQEIFQLIHVPFQVSNAAIFLDTNYLLDREEPIVLIRVKPIRRFRINSQIQLERITGIAKYGENTYYLVEQYQNIVQVYRLITEHATLQLLYKTEMQRFCYQLNDLKERRLQQHKTRIRSGYFKYTEIYVQLHQNGLLGAMQNLMKSRNQEYGFVRDYFVQVKKNQLEIMKENSILSLDELIDENDEIKVLQKITLPGECTQIKNGLLRVGDECYQLILVGVQEQ